jgi:anti-anti-sigma factor
MAMLLTDRTLAAAPEGVPGSVLVRLSGPLTAATAGAARTRFQECADRGDRSVVVDLLGVSALDACGVAALLDGQRRLVAHGGGMALRVNRIVSHALKASGTIAVFQVYGG